MIHKTYTHGVRVAPAAAYSLRTAPRTNTASGKSLRPKTMLLPTNPDQILGLALHPAMNRERLPLTLTPGGPSPLMCLGEHP